ncbi:DUF2190 family protein [Gordonia otitidis]|uniref:DUF2190 family protein n=1 Tax=Gordonia otitidis TaxID=249058 RepID=UPI001D15057B|nr:DUF2190 family protein [Gordonia otitidis]UEA58575.1 DUF2190 family protein [Gordonia otitidis]
MANETKPLFRPGASVTIRATTALSGGRLVAIASAYDGNFPTKLCPAGAKPFGVATADIASGALGTALREGIIPLIAGASITAGTQVESDAQGRVIPLNTGIPVGTAVEAGTTGLPVAVALDV